MPENTVTISRGLYDQLVLAQHEADMLKRLLMEKGWGGIDGKEVDMLCRLLGLKHDKE